MNILIATNDAYIVPTKNMLFSLAQNNLCQLNVYLLYNQLSGKHISELKNHVAQKCHGTLYPILADVSLFSDAPLQKYWSIEMYFRLLACELLPPDLERILWLDGDIIVNRSIEEFYKQDLQGCLISACQGCNDSGILRLGLPFNHLYFNSGVILFDLQKCRSVFTLSSILDTIGTYKEKLKAPDQDILNILCQGQVKYAPSDIYNNECFGNHVFSPQKMKILKSKACIIHFDGPMKPWNPKGVNWADKFWWKYAKRQGLLLQWLQYRIQNSSVKVKYAIRELFYMAYAQLNKLKRIR